MILVFSKIVRLWSSLNVCVSHSDKSSKSIAITLCVKSARALQSALAGHHWHCLSPGTLGALGDKASRALSDTHRPNSSNSSSVIVHSEKLPTLGWTICTVIVSKSDKKPNSLWNPKA